MGVWGTGIYANDIAEDVKDACKDIFAFYDTEKGNQELFRHFREIVDQDFVDNDYASFWYALADWQWKHGMLNEFIKYKTLNLLETYAGINEWNEKGNKSNVLKRRKVLDSLKLQLLTQQPSIKKPKFSLCKPKHSIGEIIVFRANIHEESVWKKESFCVPFMYKSTEISNSKFENVCGYNAQGKYMAVLCVGMEKEPCSEYIPNVYNEHSVYVWYDYLSDIEPSIKKLENCGFLPFIDLKWEDFNRNIVDSAKWEYKFVLCNEKFKINDVISIFKKYKNLNEVERFNNLFSTKNYSNDIWGGFTLSEMFEIVFEEKNRMELLGESIDNLLDLKVTNPEMLSACEIRKAFQTYVRSLRI